MAKAQSRVSELLRKHEKDLAAEWLKSLKASGSGKDSRLSDSQLQEQTKEFLTLLQQASASGERSANSAEWKAMADFLEEVSRSRVKQGFSSDETAKFIFSFKQPLFSRMRSEFKDADTLADETWAATE